MSVIWVVLGALFQLLLATLGQRADDCFRAVLQPQRSPQEEPGELRLTLTHSVLRTEGGYFPGATYQVAIQAVNISKNLTIQEFVMTTYQTIEATEVNQQFISLPPFLTHVNDSRCPSDTIALTKGSSAFVENVTVTWKAPLSDQRDPSDQKCVTFRAVAVVEEKWHHLQKNICLNTGCDQYLTQQNGSIVSPGFPAFYPDNIHCRVVIRVLDGFNIFLQAFDLEPSYKGVCYDYLMVSLPDGKNLTSGDPRPLCGTRSGQQQLEEMFFESPDNTLELWFITDRKLSGLGYKAVYYSLPQATGCCQEFLESSGVVHSSNYPGNYFPRMNCSYVIRGRQDHQIYLQIQDLNIPRGVTPQGATNCDQGFLVIKICELNREYTLCGNDSQIEHYNLHFQSTGGDIHLRFVSDYSSVGRGFYATYNSTPVCQNQTLYGASGVVSSWGYPQNYTNNADCFYIINNEGAPTHVTELQFVELDLQRGTYISGNQVNCDKDYIEIYSGRDVRQICGQKDGVENLLKFYSDGPQMVLRLVSDAQISGRGFVAKWRTVEHSGEVEPCPTYWMEHGEYCYNVSNVKRKWVEAEEDCKRKRGHLAFLVGQMLDMFVNKYVLNRSTHTPLSGYWVGGNDQKSEQDFQWTAGLPWNYTNWFPGWSNMENAYSEPSDDGLSDEDCVELRQSFYFPWKGFVLVDKLYWNDRSCQTQNFYICQKPKHGADITRYISSPVTSVTLPYPPDCSRVITLTSYGEESNGVIHSPSHPGYYGNNLDCNITILPPANSSSMSIRLQFMAFHLEYSSRCDFDFLEIASGNWSDRKRFCGDYTDKLKLLHYIGLPGEVVHLRFVSDRSNIYPGFLAKYSMTTETSPVFPLQSQSITEFQGNLTSPKFPEYYDNNSNFIWNFITPSGFQILFTILVINLEYQQDCLYDFLGFQSKCDLTLKRYCGRGKRRIYFESPCNETSVMFHSDYKGTGQGFWLTWDTIDMSSCELSPQIMTAPSGHVASLNYPVQYLNDLECVVEIQGESGQRIFLEFQDFTLDGSSTDFVALDFHDGLEKLTLSNLIYPGDMNDDIHFLSPSNKLTITFYSDGANTSKGFYATYKAVSGETTRVNSLKSLGTKAYGSVSSLNSPFQYPNCLAHGTTLKAPLGYVIELTITQVDIKLSKSCISDSLQVVDPYGGYQDNSAVRGHQGHTITMATICGQDRDIILERNSAPGSLSGHPLSHVYTSYLNQMELLFTSGCDKSGISNKEKHTGFVATFAVKEDPVFLNKTFNDAVNVSLDNCDINVCQNGGQCKSTSAKSAFFHHCQCSGYYTGLFCHITHCDLANCHSGHCHLVDNGHVCNCFDNFFGPDCNMSQAVCSQQRCHGHGQCVRSEEGQELCVCNGNWTGDSCSLLRNTKRTYSLLQQPFWLGIVVVFAGMALGGILYYFRQRFVDCWHQCCGYGLESTVQETNKKTSAYECILPSHLDTLSSNSGNTNNGFKWEDSTPENSKKTVNISSDCRCQSEDEINDPSCVSLTAQLPSSETSSPASNAHTMTNSHVLIHVEDVVTSPSTPSIPTSPIVNETNKGAAARLYAAYNSGSMGDTPSNPSLGSSLHICAKEDSEGPLVGIVGGHIKLLHPESPSSKLGNNLGGHTSKRGGLISPVGARRVQSFRTMRQCSVKCENHCHSADNSLHGESITEVEPSSVTSDQLRRFSATLNEVMLSPKFLSKMPNEISIQVPEEISDGEENAFSYGEADTSRLQVRKYISDSIRSRCGHRMSQGSREDNMNFLQVSDGHRSRHQSSMSWNTEYDDINQRACNKMDDFGKSTNFSDRGNTRNGRTFKCQTCYSDDGSSYSLGDHNFKKSEPKSRKSLGITSGVKHSSSADDMLNYFSQSQRQQISSSDLSQASINHERCCQNRCHSCCIKHVNRKHYNSKARSTSSDKPPKVPNGKRKKSHRRLRYKEGTASPSATVIGSLDRLACSEETKMSPRHHIEPSANHHRLFKSDSDPNQFRFSDESKRSNRVERTYKFLHNMDKVHCDAMPALPQDRNELQLPNATDSGHFSEGSSTLHSDVAQQVSTSSGELPPPRSPPPHSPPPPHAQQKMRQRYHSVGGARPKVRQESLHKLSLKRAAEKAVNKHFFHDPAQHQQRNEPNLSSVSSVSEVKSSPEHLQQANWSPISGTLGQKCVMPAPDGQQQQSSSNRQGSLGCSESILLTPKVVSLQRKGQILSSPRYKFGSSKVQSPSLTGHWKQAEDSAYQSNDQSIDKWPGPQSPVPNNSSFRSSLVVYPEEEHGMSNSDGNQDVRSQLEQAAKKLQAIQTRTLQQRSGVNKVESKYKKNRPAPLDLKCISNRISEDLTRERFQQNTQFIPHQSPNLGGLVEDAGPREGLNKGFLLRGKNLKDEMLYNMDSKEIASKGHKLQNTGPKEHMNQGHMFICLLDEQRDDDVPQSLMCETWV